MIDHSHVDGRSRWCHAIKWSNTEDAEWEGLFLTSRSLKFSLAMKFLATACKRTIDPCLYWAIIIVNVDDDHNTDDVTFDDLSTTGMLMKMMAFVVIINSNPARCCRNWTSFHHLFHSDSQHQSCCGGSYLPNHALGPADECFYLSHFLKKCHIVKFNMKLI